MSSGGYYLNTYSESSTQGATLELAEITARQLAMLATTGPGMGTVPVYRNGNLMQTVQLQASGVHKRTLFSLPDFGSSQTGSVDLVVSTNGKPVQLDGLIALAQAS